MLEFIDSHAHLADPAFDHDRDSVIDRAIAAGARGIICIGESIAAAWRAKAIADQQPGLLWFTAGLHPHDARSTADADSLARLRDALDGGAVAVGECGLDYHYDHSPRDVQRRVFAAQLALAAERALPVVVHTRDAEDDTRAMMDDAARDGVRGVLHCFTGSRALAEAAVANGWFVSFSGIVTFPKWTDDDLLRAVPDERLLAESDAPYLAPVPHRGRRNEPAWVESTLQRLAGARETPVEEIGQLVHENARRFFALASPPSP